VVALLSVRVVIGGHGLGRDGVVEAAELALDVGGEGVAVVPVHELLVLVGYLALAVRTWSKSLKYDLPN